MWHERTVSSAAGPSVLFKSFFELMLDCISIIFEASMVWGILVQHVPGSSRHSRALRVVPGLREAPRSSSFEHTDPDPPRRYRNITRHVLGSDNNWKGNLIYTHSSPPMLSPIVDGRRKDIELDMGSSKAVARNRMELNIKGYALFVSSFNILYFEHVRGSSMQTPLI